MNINNNFYQNYVPDFNNACNMNYFNNLCVNYETQGVSPAIATKTNKYIYVNQNVCQSTKVLINPNFKATIHINPNFNKAANKVHVNPQLLNGNRKNFTPLMKLNNLAQVNVSNINNHKSNNSELPKYITSNNNKKLIRRSLLKVDNAEEKKLLLRTGSNSAASNGIITKPSVNRYKLDRRSKSRLSTLQKTSQSFCTKYVFIKNAKLNRTKYVKVNGVMYKYSPNKSLVNNPKVQKKRLSLSKMKTNKFQLTLNNSKTPALLRNVKYNSQYVKGGNRYKYVKRESSNSFCNVPERKTKLRRLSLRKTNVGKLKKCNLPCQVYKKYGKCARKDEGKCLKVHNPDQVSLCTKFLRGACLEKNCLLSHNISPEKMPTCNYFLDGRCFKDDCPYLHVKVSAKADICKDFLEGFCKLAKECDKRHQYLCPEFEKNNICKKLKCPYPHGNMVRNVNLLSQVTKRTKVKKNAKQDIPNVSDNAEKNIRYYVNPSSSSNVEVVNETKSACKTEIVDLQENAPHKRTIIGHLPKYIPLLDKLS